MQKTRRQSAGLFVLLLCAACGGDIVSEADGDGGQRDAAGDGDSPLDGSRGEGDGDGDGDGDDGNSGGDGGGGGDGDGEGGPAGDGDASTPQGTPVFVAVGYSGRRIRSLDLGKTWIDEVTLPGPGGDSPTLLRAVAFGAGTFVAVGHRIFTSKDGSAASWQERTNPQNQWLGGIQYGGGRFVATGGYGYSAISTNGTSWNPSDGLGTEASRSLAFGDGTFVSATDPGNWWSSSNGESWTVLSGGHSGVVAFCNGEFRSFSACTGTFSAGNQAVGEGVTVRVTDSGQVQRSENGEDFTPVDSEGDITGIAFGYVE